jgi:hypothetical protein
MPLTDPPTPEAWILPTTRPPLYMFLRWDITPFSGQVKQSTNAFSIQNYFIFSFPKNVELEVLNGSKDRFVFATQDVRLLNTGSA